MGYQNGVSQNMYLVSQSLEMCIFGCHFCLKSNYIWSEKAEILICCEELLYKVWRHLPTLEKSWDFKFSKSSLEFLRIHIRLTPLLEYAVEQYLWSDSLIAVSSLVSNKDSGLVEQLLEPEMYLCLYGFFKFNFGIQYELILIFRNVESI
jgi:hypothetical protein